MRNILKTLSFVFLLSLPAILPSAAFSMTVLIEPGTLKDNKQADMNLSGLILRKVQWEDGALMMPVTVSNDRSYNDVKLISRDLYLKMEDCFINGCREASPSDNPTLPAVKIEAIKKLNSKFRVTNIEISFDNAITVSVGIMADNYPDGTFWLSYPQSIGFSSRILQEHTDNVVFKAFAEENPHLKVVRASQASTVSSASKEDEEDKSAEQEEEKIAVLKTPVFEDETKPSRKSRKTRAKKSSSRKSRKKKSSSDDYYYDPGDVSGGIYEAR